MKNQHTAILELIRNYGYIDGSHHKQWLLDQIVRLLADDYQQWIIEFEQGDDGPHTFEWDIGIAP